MELTVHDSPGIHPAGGPPRTSALASLLRFGGISGLGWLLDAGLLFILVRWGHVPVFLANLISASTAAIVVFLVSHKLVFRGGRDGLVLRVLFYAAYTLAIIAAVSAAVSYLAFFTSTLSIHLHHPLSTVACAMIAKVVVTPINFLINFIVARFTSEHARALPPFEDTTAGTLESDHQPA